MTIRNLDALFEPKSVAVIGASPRAGSLGNLVLGNIVAGGFRGPVWPVNPRHDSIMGLACLPSIAALPGAPDIAVVATPPASLPQVIADLGARGCRLAVVTRPGVPGDLRQAMLDGARPYLLRVIGPNTLGVLLPHARLNASFAHMGAAPGEIALLSQSGTIATTLIDWAAEHGVGFSRIISLGDMADVDIGDCLDLIAQDGRSRAVLVYLETVPEARKFLSAARTCSRVKPVIALKAGRSPQAAQAALTHTGALSGADAVVDAALARAGILRVRGLLELFAAAETLARFRPMARARVGIVTNAGGAGVMAVDRLMDGAGELATLAPATLARLDAAIPGNWSRANPVDLNADAPPERYLAALEAVAEDPGVDAILVMNCPTALAAPVEAARAVADRVQKGTIGQKPVLSCWLGGETAREARAVLRARGAASYAAPATAAAAVGHLTEWGRAQAALLHVPDRAGDEDTAPAAARAKVAALFAAAATEGRRFLSEPEAKAVLAAYGIPAPAGEVAATPQQVGTLAAGLLGAGGRVVVKMLSRDIPHKSDLGGVVLALETPAAAIAAAEGIAERVRTGAPGKTLDGFSVQPMIERRDALELILGVARDPVFGPVLLFGAGGIAVELTRDTAVALPPLDAGLAAGLIARTRIGAQLAGFRNRPPANAAALQGALVALSHLVEDFPCLRALDVNPLIADADGVLALDARIEIDPHDRRPAPNPDMAIRPYPGTWRRSYLRPEGTYQIRPIRPVDALLYPEFWKHTTPEDIRKRFLAPRKGFSREAELRWTQLDYDREVAFIALTPDGELAGVSRVSSDPDHRHGEYSLLVRSDMQGKGVGSALMQILIDYATADGLERLDGYVLADNRGMLGLISRFGFQTAIDREDPGVLTTWRDLSPDPRKSLDR